MVRRQAEQIPAEFYEGIAEVVVSPRTVAHPDRGDIWTMGECIPIASEDPDPRYLQSRVVLYHGSFQALAHETRDHKEAVDAFTEKRTPKFTGE